MSTPGLGDYSVGHEKESGEFLPAGRVILKEGACLPSFAECVLGCYAPLYRYARSLCGEPREAEELLQETCKRALAAKRKPVVANADEMRPWIFTIMRNVWRNERRRISRSREILLEDPIVPASGEDTEFGITRKLLVSEVRAAVDSLPVIWREIIVMRDMEDLSYAEIAAILGCPIGTVMSRLARARKALRQLLMPRVPEMRR